MHNKALVFLNTNLLEPIKGLQMNDEAIKICIIFSQNWLAQDLKSIGMAQGQSALVLIFTDPFPFGTQI